MKTSTVLASLFGALAAAAPLDKRARVTKTNVVMETVVVYTTVWDGEAPAATTTTTTPAAVFYEQTSSRAHRTRSRRPRSSSAAVATSTSVYVAPVETSVAAPSSEAPVESSVYVAPPAPTTTTQEAPVTTPEAPATTAEAPAATSEAAAPVAPTSTYVAPAEPATSTAAQAPAATGGSGQTYSGGSLTMNYYGGGTGACGDPIADTDMAVALAVDTFGDSTVDVMTGKTTNKFCNAKIAITYNGVTANAVIKDRCAGCTNGGLDATPKLWEALTGGLGGASGDRISSGMSWSMVN